MTFSFYFSMLIAFSLCLGESRLFIGMQPEESRSELPANDILSTAIMPLEIKGSISSAGRRRMLSQLQENLRRMDFEIIDWSTVPPPLEPCTQAECIQAIAQKLDVPLLITTQIEIRDRDYTFHLAMMDGATGEPTVTVEDSCQLCGFEEAGQVLASAAIVLTERYRRWKQTQHPPEISPVTPVAPPPTMIEPPPPMVSNKQEANPKSIAPLRVSGAIATGLGGAGLILMSVGIAQTIQADRKGEAYVASDRSELSEDQIFTDVQAYRQQGQRGEKLTMAGAIVGGAFLVAGVTMLIVDSKRRKSQSVLAVPDFGPSFAGIRAHLNF